MDISPSTGASALADRDDAELGTAKRRCQRTALDIRARRV
jgi:hypothetical protein